MSVRYYSSPYRREPQERIGVKNLEKRIQNIRKDMLSEKALVFVDSLMEESEKKGGLTPKQIRYLEQIESRFSPEEVKKFEEWKEIYNATYKKDAMTLAKYYNDHTSYWISMCSNIVNVSDYVPGRHAFMKMLGNKYAKKVLESTNSEPKYAVNSKVQLRKIAAVDKGLRGRICFVLSNTEPVKSAVKGGKGYKILPMGHSRPIFTEERLIMKPNKNGVNKAP